MANVFQKNFPCEDDYPNFTGHISLLSQHCTKELYAKLRDCYTASGFTIDKLIQNGTDNSDFHVGLLCGDEECYTTYAELLDPVIRDYHNGFRKGTDKHTTDLDPEKLTGPDELDPDYVVSTRIRTGRNIKGYCLSPHVCRAERRAIEKIVADALSSLGGEFAGKYYDLPNMTPADQQQLIDDHFLFDRPVSRHFTSGGMARDFPDGRGIWHNNDKNFLVWVNEEDHMRIISMEMGGNMKRVFARWAKGLADVEAKMKTGGKEFMWCEDLGFILTCPTNIGTGVRCSVHMKVPKLSQDPRFDQICRAYRLQQRGTSGEFTESIGGVYDISNLDRLGTSEVQQTQCVIDGVQALIKLEKCLEEGGSIDDQLPELPEAHKPKE